MYLVKRYCFYFLVKASAVSFKDLTKSQLDYLKDIYIDSRVSLMSEEDLKKLVKEVLDIQIKGTVGNDEELEVWKEMGQHFEDCFENKIKEVVKFRGLKEERVEPEQEDYLKRLELLKQRNKEKDQKNVAMWDDN